LRTTPKPEVIDDLFICAETVAIDGVGSILGSAGAEYYRVDSKLPISGTMRFDTADADWLVAEDDFEAVVLHEIGHVVS